MNLRRKAVSIDKLDGLSASGLRYVVEMHSFVALELAAVSRGDGDVGRRLPKTENTEGALQYTVSRYGRSSTRHKRYGHFQKSQNKNMRCASYPPEARCLKFIPDSNHTIEPATQKRSPADSTQQKQYLDACLSRELSKPKSATPKEELNARPLRYETVPGSLVTLSRVRASHNAPDHLDMLRLRLLRPIKHDPPSPRPVP